MDVSAFITLWQKMKAAGDVPNGVILSGTHAHVQGEGREALISLMMCSRPTSESTSCGTCEFCVHAHGPQSITHCRLEVQEGRNVPIDDIRQMQHMIMLSRQSEQPYYVIIPAAADISEAGWNSMLKTIEEPPRGVVFIVFAAQLKAIPITVRSRLSAFFIHSQADEVVTSTPAGGLTHLSSAMLERFLETKPTQIEDWDRWLVGLRQAYLNATNATDEALTTRLSGAFIEIADVLGRKRRDGSINLKYEISHIVSRYSP